MPRALLLVSLVAALAGGVAQRAVASCVGLTADQQFALADVIFDGVALDGPTATGVERFRVLTYLKSSGPQLIHIETGRRTNAWSSVAIAAKPGERWRIYARRHADGRYDTNQCNGSRRLAPAAADPADPQWLPTLTLAGRFGMRSLVESDGAPGPVPSASVRKGELLTFRFNFQPTSVLLQRRSRHQLLRPQQTVAWRVSATGTYLVRLTATWTRQEGSETVRFTSSFSIRLTARL